MVSRLQADAVQQPRPSDCLQLSSRGRVAVQMFEAS